MTDIVQILKDMQQDKGCPILVHMALSEAISEIERLRSDRDYLERNANESVAALKKEIARLEGQVEQLEGTHSPITEEVEDILRSEIAKRDVRIKELEERRCEICGYAEHHREHTGCLRVFVNEQAAEIERLKAVIGKCKETLGSNISDLQEPNFVTLASWRVREALAAIKEEGL